MAFTIKTAIFQNMVNRAVKGAGKNNLLPLTTLIAIENHEGTLTLTTTDGNNILQIIEQNIGGDDFYAVVAVDLFSKLIAKISSEHVTLDIPGDYVSIKGNGSYKVPLPPDEEGEPIIFPLFSFDTTVPESEVNLSTIKNVLAVNKAATAKTMEEPCYTGYYFGDAVITTDRIVICHNDMQVFEDDRLLPYELVQLLGVMQTEKIKVQIDGSAMLFTTDDCVIYGKKMSSDDQDSFMYTALKDLISTEYPSTCSIIKSAVLDALDRVSLFIGPYDNDTVILTFTKTQMTMESKAGTGYEVIDLKENKKAKPFTCNIDSEMLKFQLQSHEGEVVEFYYGNPDMFQLKQGNVTQIISLLDDEGFEEEAGDDGEE